MNQISSMDVEHKMDIKDWLPEFQVSAETDEELQSYFFQTPEVQKITQSKSWLVLGRKGTGKTAIFQYLKK
jgi:Cdc6-like AAA superfamily ATPase